MYQVGFAVMCPQKFSQLFSIINYFGFSQFLEDTILRTLLYILVIKTDLSQWITFILSRRFRHPREDRVRVAPPTGIKFYRKNQWHYQHYPSGYRWWIILVVLRFINVSGIQDCIISRIFYQVKLSGCGKCLLWNVQYIFCIESNFFYKKISQHPEWIAITRSLSKESNVLIK